jgi:hypothetical protein
MRRATLALYVVFGIGAAAAGIAAVFWPALVLPPGEATGLPAHLTQEQGAGFVFIGLMCLWTVRHFDQRRPIHFALIVFTLLFAGVHLQGYLRGGVPVRAVIANFVPVTLLVLTAPWSRPRS